MKEENLTKENFWNDIKEKSPKATKEFCDWADVYKEENDWRELFSNEKELWNGKFISSIKYHDLPIAMQFGIFVQFMMEISDKYFVPLSEVNVFVYRSFNREFQNSVMKIFIDLEKILSNQSSNQ